MAPKSLTLEEKIDKLVESITLASQAYYGGQTPLIPDEAFDKLLLDLRNLSPRHPLLSRVGHGFVPKVQVESKHLIGTVGSLPKVHELSELENLAEQDVWTPKLDGISIVAYYDEGKLSKILTRGDGTKGIEVTHKISVPSKLSDPRIVAIRGEAVISNSDFNKFLAKDYSNPRNACAGIVNSFDSSYYDLVRFVAYAVTYLPSALVVMNPDGVMDIIDLEKKGFAVPHHLRHKKTTTKKELNDWRKTCPYPTDGVVLNGVKALKFPTEEKDTKVKEVEWNYSTTGRLIPVIIFDEISLHGTKVNRASAFNAKYIEDNKIAAGTKVTITKANEIIPHIVKVVSTGKKGDLISACPKCSGKVDWDGVHLKCASNCQSTYFRLIHFVETFCADIKGLGKSVLASIFKALDVGTISDLIDLVHQSEMSIDNSSLTKHEKKMAKAMVKVIGGELDQGLLLRSMNLDGVGRTNSRELSPYLDDICNNGTDWMDKIKQNKDTVIAQVLASIGEISHVYRNLKWKKPDTSLIPKFCLTGKMNLPRNDILKRLAGYGFKDGSPAKGIILVCSDPNSSSSKMKKAKKLGLEIITEVEMWDKLASGEIS